MIQIICGVYGHYINGQVIAKDKNSEPFELSPEREAELVAKGVAVYVTPAPIGFDETPPELPEDVIPIPEYSIENTAKELREIGKICGLTFKVGMSKANMVAALDEFFEEHLEDEDPDDDDIAPVFDAAEAVL